MTCREKLAIEHPNKIDPTLVGGCVGCPHNYGYAKQDVTLCNMLGPSFTGSPENYPCAICWDREVSGENPRILDSGNRREFETGAVRDIQEGKGRCDLMPLDVVGAYLYGSEWVDRDYKPSRVFVYINQFQKDGQVDYLIKALHEAEIFEDSYAMLLEVSKHFEEGCKKYGENNWRKGIPVRCYIDSAVRHYLKFLRGDKDERHDRAFCWNLMCAIWTCKHKPELNEYADEEKER